MVRPLPKHRARDYETIFIIHPDTSVDAIEQVANRVTDAIDRLQGKLLKAENWGKRRLAYPVKKQQQGYYIYLRFLGYSDLVHEIERNLRMMEPVIKYLTVKIDEDVDPAARPVSENDISFVPQVIEEAEILEEDGEDTARDDDDPFADDDDEDNEEDSEIEGEDTAEYDIRDSAKETEEEEVE